MPTLHEIISSEIARNGPMPFRRFMELALYEPNTGYYASGRAGVGRRGDFMTSVSVGPLFGQLLTAQFEEMWETMGRPARFGVIEQGANNGDFAHDVLSASRSCPEFNAALHYGIVEPFPVLAARQQKRLVEFGSKVEWHDALETLPAFCGVHFSNELVDAMPVHRLRFHKGEWRECHVGIDLSGRFQWTDGPLSTPALSAFLSHLPEIEGFETEVNLEALEWIENVSRCLERGYVLVVDYGYRREDFYSRDLSKGTLASYRQHRVCENPLEAPGEQDITAHVDFTTLADRGKQNGLILTGFTDQHHFLAAVGQRLFPNIASLSELTPARQKEMRAFATLIHPTLMGRGFHYLTLAKNAPLDLCGYSLAGNARSFL